MRQDIFYLHATCWMVTGSLERGKLTGMQQDVDNTVYEDTYPPVVPCLVDSRPEKLLLFCIIYWPNACES
jgi:hypothetical protein